jgi:hypothetical protein
MAWCRRQWHIFMARFHIAPFVVGHTFVKAANTKSVRHGLQITIF